MKFLDHGCPKCVQFSEKFFYVWKPEFTDTIFLITPVMYLHPFLLGTPGNCPADHPPSRSIQLWMICHFTVMLQIAECPVLNDSCLPRPNTRMKSQHSLKKKFVFHHLPLRRQATLYELPTCLQGDKILVSTQHCLALQHPYFLNSYCLYL